MALEGYSTRRPPAVRKFGLTYQMSYAFLAALEYRTPNEWELEQDRREDVVQFLQDIPNSRFMQVVELPRYQAEKMRTVQRYKRELNLFSIRREIEETIERVALKYWNIKLLRKLRQLQRESPNVEPKRPE